jgi:hypothetical protein
MIKVFHNVLTKEERTRLNGPNGGWDSEPRFSRYADVTCFGSAEAALAAWEAGDYTHVADVYCEGKEWAYRQTNHIESNWQDNSDVMATDAARDGAKSTSVGDVLVMENGDRYVVASFGFEKF